MEKVTINQFVPSVHAFDAVGSTCLLMDGLFRQSGYDSKIYALYRDPELSERVTVFTRENAPNVHSDINILHFALPSPLTEFFSQCGGKRVLIYHNITPPRYFQGFQEELVEFTALGLREIASLVAEDIHPIAYSAFSGRDLMNFGYSDPVILPFLIDWDRYKQPGNPVIKRMFHDEWKNILFVGRLVPNKKQDDLIRILECYRRRFNKKCRLILVGKGREGEKYCHELNALMNSLANPPVVMAGRVSIPELISYYNVADLFLCLSEHEGFCVPLIEAMYFDVPVLAYRAAAIPDTLARSGIVLDKKEPDLFAATIHELFKNSQLRAQVIDEQQKRLKDFLHESSFSPWIEYIQNL